MRPDYALDLQNAMEAALNEHLRLSDKWDPARYIPWGEGLDYIEFPPERGQHRFSRPVRAALKVALATEEGLPDYRTEIAFRFGHDPDTPWGGWLRQWTAEENRHGRALWAYLACTRGQDSQDLDDTIFGTLQAGYHAGSKSLLNSLVYTAIQELATRVSHTRTGLAARTEHDLAAHALLQRIAKDENRHYLVYRRLVDAALEQHPSATVIAISEEIRTFDMPGKATIPGFDRLAAVIARAGIFDLTIYAQQVIAPLLKHWKLLDLTGLNGEAEHAREHLAQFLADLQQAEAEAPNTPRHAS